MASQDVQKNGDSTNKPELWSDSKLLETPLGALSRNLSASVSQRRTLAIYLKWLELHRLNPSDLSKHWENTLMHWTQALRSRGFDKDELIVGVKKWKKDNEPFQSSPTAWPFKRNPPMPYDIVKAWPEAENRIYASTSSKKADSYRPSKSEEFSGKPPGDYVCNRCGIEGHFLEVCPTNMDPSYDRPPNMSYCCPICKESGKHYKSICPLNTDPLSIIQKRRYQGIDTPGSSDSAILRDWERDIDKHENYGLFRGRRCSRSMVLDSGSTAYQASMDWGQEDGTRPTSPTGSTSNKRTTKEILRRIKEIDDMKLRIHESDCIGTEDVKMIGNSFEYDRTSQKRTRAASPDSISTRSRRSFNEKSPSPTKERILRNKIAAIEYAEKYGGQSPAMGATDYAAEKAALLVELYKEENSTDSMDRDYEVDVKMEDNVVDVSKNAPSAKRTKIAYHHRQTSSSKGYSSKMDVDKKELPSPAKPLVMKHSEFIRKLMDRRPEMKDVVNPVSRRPTALDMWNDDDDRRLKQMSISAQRSPSPSRFDGDEECLAKYEKEIMDMSRTTDRQFDTPTFDSPLTPSDFLRKESMKQESEWS